MDRHGCEDNLRLVGKGVEGVGNKNYFTPFSRPYLHFDDAQNIDQKILRLINYTKSSLESRNMTES